jgi:C-terminal processing protease CtpA/Prc
LKESVSNNAGNLLISLNTRLSLDYRNKKIYLEENGRFGSDIPVNCSGIDVQLKSDRSGVLIHQVYDNSAASEKGIMVNDELLSVNGKSVQEMTLIEIEEVLKMSGKTVELVVKRGNEELSVEIELKELI